MPILRDLDPRNLPNVSDARLIPVISALLVLFGVNLYTLQKDQSEKIQAAFLASIRDLSLEELARLNIPSVLEKILQPLGLKSSMSNLKDEDAFAKENLAIFKKVLAELEQIIKENQAAFGKIGSEAIAANLKNSLEDIKREGEEGGKNNALQSLTRTVLRNIKWALDLEQLLARLANLFLDVKNVMDQAGATLLVRLRTGTSVRLRSAVIVDTSDENLDRVAIGFKAPRKHPKEDGRKFEHLSAEEQKEAAVLATTHLLHQMEHAGFSEPRLKPRSVHIRLKTLAHLAKVAAHDERMHHVHQAFAANVLPESSYVSVRDVEIQAVLALMHAINAEYALPVSHLTGLYDSAARVSSISIPTGPTPGVR